MRRPECQHPSPGLPALGGGVGVDRPEVDAHCAPGPDVLSEGLDGDRTDARDLPLRHAMVRHEIVQERGEVDLPMFGRRAPSSGGSCAQPVPPPAPSSQGSRPYSRSVQHPL
jgi:hypothetical protein